MPEETTAVAEPEKQEQGAVTPLADVFDKVFGKQEGEQQPESVKEPVKEVESEKKPEAKKEEPPKKEEPKPDEHPIPESVFDLTKPAGELPKEAEETPIEKIEPPPEMKGKARENFQALSDKYHSAETSRRTLEKELQKTKQQAEAGDPNAKARIDSLEKENARLSSVVERANIELHPAFQERYTIPRERALEAARSLFKDAGGSDSQLDRAINLTGKAKAEALDEIYETVTSPSMRSRLERYVDSIDAIDQEKGEVIKNSKEQAQQLAEMERVNQHKALENHKTKTLQHISDGIEYLREQGGIEVFRKSDDPKFGWWNEQADRLRSETEKIMLEITDPRALAQVAALATTALPYRKLFQEERKRNKELNDLLKDYKESEPDIGGKGGRPEVAGKERDKLDSVFDKVLGAPKDNGQ